MKYKKLDNLDDLRVGDLIGEVYTVISIKDGWINLAHSGSDVVVVTATFEFAKQRDWRAKRPLPKKKEKVEKWQPKMDEQYFFPRFHDQISGYVAQTIWDGGEWDRNLMKLSMVFRTRRECEESALKMIKAINPSYNE